MEERKKIPRDLSEGIELVREHLKVIQVNMEVLEVLKMKGAITFTDKAFIEILNLDKKHRKTFEDFLLGTLPDYLNSETQVTEKVLMKQFELWISDLIISLSYLDKQCKSFIQERINEDKKLKRAIKEIDVKDKRFWRFLDRVKSKSKVFESFSEESEDAQIFDQ